MSITLQAESFPNINLAGKPKSTLSDDVAKGDTVLPVASTEDFAAGNVVYIGLPATERCEQAFVESVDESASTITLSSALKHQHYQYDKVIGAIGYKIRIYRAANTNDSAPIDGEFSSYGSQEISPEQVTTYFVDALGSSDYWYKVTYWNPANDNETALADSAAVRGGGLGNYVSIELIRGSAGIDENMNVTDGYVDSFRQAAQALVNGALKGKYVIPFTNPVNPLIEQIVREWAAGKLQEDQYGSAYTSQDSKNGSARVTWAEAQLERIRSGQLVLVDGATPESSAETNQGFSAYPNDTTEAAGGSGFMFERAAIDGYEGRTY